MSGQEFVAIVTREHEQHKTKEDKTRNRASTGPRGCLGRPVLWVRLFLRLLDHSCNPELGDGSERNGGGHVRCTMESNAAASGSKRWTYFYSALQLAIQRSAHKWRFVFSLL